MVDCNNCFFPFTKKKTMSTYFYTKTIATEDGTVKTYKFLKG